MVDVDAIADLRRAAVRQLGPDEWVGDALRKALAEWSTADMLALAESVLRAGLATFERHEPGADWPRRALDGEVTELGPDYMGPGSNSLASGVEYLLDARAAAAAGDTAACREAVVEAIPRAVMAQMCAAWGDLYPEAWRRSLQAAIDGVVLPYEDNPSIGWGDHPRVLKVERTMWTDIADRIAARG